MNFIKILFVGSYLASLEHFTFCEDVYKVMTFRGITEVQNNGKIPYIEEHPDANTDQFSEEKRRELCREGLKRIRRDEKGIHYRFLENTETKKMKVYVLVNPPSPDVSDDIFKDDIVEVRPAYTCPTNPSTYIHVDRDQRDATSFWVILKEQGPIFTFSQINTYQLHTAAGLEEAIVEQLSQASADIFVNSGFDTDILTESQRLHMCNRGMNIAPEIGIVVDKNCTTWGASKYYQMSYPDDDEDDSVHTYWQAFSCPTTPVMYVTVTQGYKQDDRTFWSIVKSSDVKQLPLPNILGYRLVIAHSLVGEGEPKPNEDEKLEPVSAISRPVEDNKSSPVPESSLSQSSAGEKIISPFERRQRETKHLLNAMDSALKKTTTSMDQLPLLESTNRFKQMVARRGLAAINTDCLKNEVLLHICSKAIITVFGKTAQFTGDTAGRRRLYRYKDFIESRDTIPYYSMMEAFRCPTRPEIFIHIDESVNTATYEAHVIIRKGDLALQITQ